MPHNLPPLQHGDEGSHDNIDDGDVTHEDEDDDCYNGKLYIQVIER